MNDVVCVDLRTDAASRAGHDRDSAVLPLPIAHNRGPAKQVEIALTTDWLNALVSNTLALHAQKITRLIEQNAADSQWYEVLLRMRGEGGTVYSPGEFIPVAERFGLMPTIDRWVIGRALDWILCASVTSLKLSINISATSIERADVLRSILQKLDQSDLNPAQICFELTETASISDFTQVKIAIEALRARGCAIALDDFGTGASSFAYLRYMDVDYLKIDAGFVNSLQTNPANLVLVKAMVQIANNLHIQTIAEGIEDRTTIETLRQLGVGYGQGYWMGDVFPLHGARAVTARSAGLA